VERELHRLLIHLDKAGHPEIAEPLQHNRTMLSTLDFYSDLLKTRHKAWKEQLATARPESEEGQIANEALEIALKEMEDRLSLGSPGDDDQPLSLDAAMAFLKRHTPPG